MLILDCHISQFMVMKFKRCFSHCAQCIKTRTFLKWTQKDGKICMEFLNGIIESGKKNFTLQSFRHFRPFFETEAVFIPFLRSFSLIFMSTPSNFGQLTLSVRMYTLLFKHFFKKLLLSTNAFSKNFQRTFIVVLEQFWSYSHSLFYAIFGVKFQMESTKW